MVVLAQLTKGSRCCNNDQVGDVTAKDFLIEDISDAGCKAILLRLTIVRIGGTAQMPGT